MVNTFGFTFHRHDKMQLIFYPQNITEGQNTDVCFNGITICFNLSGNLFQNYHYKLFYLYYLFHNGSISEARSGSKGQPVLNNRPIINLYKGPLIKKLRSGDSFSVLMLCSLFSLLNIRHFSTPCAVFFFNEV